MSKILVFTMGKVGSSSMIYALKKQEFEVDRGYEDNLKDLSPLADYQAVYTLVRDPIARNVSCFFEAGGEEFLREGHSNETLKEIFLEEVDHDYPLTWFDNVFRPIIGVDVYKHNYPLIGPLMLGKVCIMKTDQMVVEHRAKTEDTRPYGALYKEFLDWVKFDDVYVNRLYSNKFVSHFFIPIEIKLLRDRWSE